MAPYLSDPARFYPYKCSDTQWIDYYRAETWRQHNLAAALHTVQTAYGSQMPVILSHYLDNAAWHINCKDGGMHQEILSIERWDGSVKNSDFDRSEWLDYHRASVSELMVWMSDSRAIAELAGTYPGLRNVVNEVATVVREALGQYSYAQWLSFYNTDGKRLSEEKRKYDRIAHS